MSSRFVSAGGAEVKAPEGLSKATDDAWTKAREQVEKNKVPTVEVPAAGTQADGKSLYEHLQTQKALKQEEFEEAAKLKNQFRPLDESEVDFLEGVRRRERNAAAEVQRQTAEQLKAFRQVQAAANQAEVEGDRDEKGDVSERVGTNAWATSKKRRRQHDVEDKDDLTKARKTAPNSIGGKPFDAGTQSEKELLVLQESELPSETSNLKATKSADAATTVAAKPALNLGYDSDSD